MTHSDPGHESIDAIIERVTIDACGDVELTRRSGAIERGGNRGPRTQ